MRGVDDKRRQRLAEAIMNALRELRAVAGLARVLHEHLQQLEGLQRDLHHGRQST